MSDQTTLRIDVTARVQCSNGVEVSIREESIELWRPGPKGGMGASVTIPLTEWDVVSSGVERLREAIRNAKAIVSKAAP